MKKRLLIQTQLSNITPEKKFVLECDSGWQMCVGRVREMLKLNPDLYIDIMGPYWDLDGQCQLKTHPRAINKDLFDTGRVKYIEHWIYPNALVTRYDFDYGNISYVLGLDAQKRQEDLRYDAVYINDPLHLKNFKAMFLSAGGYRPRYYVHSHFVDLPSCPKFPVEASLWHGQCEAAIKADWNFWQCESALREFERDARKLYRDDVVDAIMAKSSPSDDGYSQGEITSPIDEKKLRFSVTEFARKTNNKVIIFFPNRISPNSGDYTNGIRWMFEFLPKLRELRQDFVVVCGNPNQKFTNKELEEKCGQHGYVNLVPDSLNRDEYKFVASYSDVVVSLYDAKSDAYGGTALRECIELGCVPLAPNCNEYSSIARVAGYDHLLAKSDLSDLVSVADRLIGNLDDARMYHIALREEVRRRCSYEQTVSKMMKKMGLL